MPSRVSPGGRGAATARQWSGHTLSNWHEPRKMWSYFQRIYARRPAGLHLELVSTYAQQYSQQTQTCIARSSYTLSHTLVHSLPLTYKHSCVLSPTFLHTLLRTLSHSPTHTLEYSPTHTLTHSLPLSYTHSCVLSYTHSCALSPTYLHTLLRTLLHTLLRTLSHSPTHTPSSDWAQTEPLCSCFEHHEVSTLI